MNEGLFTSKTSEWGTPQEFFNKLNAEFNFTLDPCCTHDNAKCVKHYTKEEDGLSQDWTGERVYCNPPYGREIAKWVKKAHDSKCLTVMLLPARTDTKWFHQYIYIYIYMLKSGLFPVGSTSTMEQAEHLSLQW